MVCSASRVVQLTLLLLAAVVPLWCKSLYEEPKYETIRVRLIAREQPLPVTGFGRNTHSYIVELQSKSGAPSLALMSFRFLQYENVIPASLFHYNMSHRFRAQRDHECDARLSAKTANGDLQYSADAPHLRGDTEMMLPCYVVRPRDYQGSDRAKKKVHEASQFTLP